MATRTKGRIGKATRSSRVLACSNCRARKTKCDGGQPGCKTCEVYKDQCQYDRPPPMSTVQAMSQRLREYEQRIEELEQQSNLPPASPATPSQPRHATALATVPSSDVEARQDDSTVLSSTDASSVPPDVTVDEHGKVAYYGPTSALYDPAHSVTLDHRHTPSQGAKYDHETRSQLVSKAIESQEWQELALHNAAMRTHIPTPLLTELLKLHWSWIAPMFMWVYRPAFIRDMSTGGQYCSEFLLTVLCAHSARFDDEHTSEALTARARLLLGQEIQSASSISSVQALLQLSARELAFGGISQAWLYSGMAFRMVTDLGLHHSGSVSPLNNAKAEDAEIRKRLFWSCYFWDKSISLYLGRMPVLRELPSDQGPNLLDDSAEHELWIPYYGSRAGSNPTPPQSYPPMRSHSISCFENSCKLAVIINDIIEKLYSRRASPESSMRSIAERLSAWRLATPSHLRYDHEDLAATCGPPHILTQNLLYHASCILLHRPFSAATRHRSACRAAADAIEALLHHFEATFGFTRVTYLMAYCVYLGASVMTQDVKQGCVIASVKIETFLRALQGSCKTCPSIRRSLDIIQASLAGPAEPPKRMQSHPEEKIHDFLPAFPHCEPNAAEGGINFDNFFDLDGISMLDSFPEAHLDLSDTDWYGLL